MKKKMKKKTKIIILLALVLIAMIAASVYTVMIRPSMNEVKTEYEATTVTRGDVIVTVNESGSISYAQTTIKYELDLDVSDDDDDDEDEEEATVRYLVIEEVYKASGELVDAGDALIRFNEKSIEGVRKLLAATVAEAKVDYNDAKSEYELSVLEAETDYKTTLINAEYAKKLYNDASSKVSDNISSIQAEITQLQSKTESLEEAITTATEKYNDAYEKYTTAKGVLDTLDPGTSSSLYSKYQTNYIQAQTNYYNALTSLENAENSLASNKEQISNLKTRLKEAKNSKDLDSSSAKQTYEEAVQSGDNAYLVYTAKLESLEEDLAEARENLEKKEKQQAAFEELVGEDGIVYAPGDGLIVSINVSEGDELTSDKTLVSYVTSEDLTITVDVTEEDIISLSIGNSVNIDFTAYPDETFEGTITSIETTSTSSNTNTVSYPVVISIPGDLTRMYGGMSTRVSFVVDKSEDTLYISRKALVEKGGNFYVYVKNALQEYELKKVTIGLKNTSYVEITSGLEEGDTVYIATTGA